MFGLMEHGDESFRSLGIVAFQIVALIDDHKLELPFLESVSHSPSEVIGNDIDLCTKGALAREDDIDTASREEFGAPSFKLIGPVESNRARTHNKDGPCLSEVACQCDCLHCLSETHFITDEKFPILTNAKDDTLSLKGQQSGTQLARDTIPIDVALIGHINGGIRSEHLEHGRRNSHDFKWWAVLLLLMSDGFQFPKERVIEIHGKEYESRGFIELGWRSERLELRPHIERVEFSWNID